jgi:hypothetical protein
VYVTNVLLISMLNICMSVETVANSIIVANYDTNHTDLVALLNIEAKIQYEQDEIIM